jgi:DNA processing protein
MTISEAEGAARLRLCRTRSVGPISYRQLLHRFGTAQAALEALPALARRGGGEAPVPPTVAEIDREREAVVRAGARYIFLDEPDYPAPLGEVENAPPVLIVAGRIQLAHAGPVAIVGARNASAAAIRFARQLGHDLAASGVAVASGLARGIDTAAHEGSIAGGTIGVIAGGIDVVYPPENDRLQRAIAEQGLLVSEQPPGTEPRARHFPYRNRIIAGLGAGTVVVEAAPKSGSLITARLAAEFGREVMAVPGSPLDPRAQGCNQLIRDGATLVQSAADVLESVQPFGASRLAAPHVPFRHDMGGEASEAERRGIENLLGPSPVPVDELIRLAGVAPSIVQLVLLELELAGRLERHAGGRVSMR